MVYAPDPALAALLERTAWRGNPHHDSKGRFASSSSHGTPAQLHDEAHIRATYDYHDEATGLTAKVEGIYGGSDPGLSTHVSITITDRDGKKVGEAFRSIRPADMATVAHASVALAPHMQGQGFMTRYSRQVEQSYRDHGIKRIELHAGGGGSGLHQASGSYAWARAGYDFANPGTRGLVAHAAIEHGGRPGTPAKVRAEFARVAANPHATPADFAMIGHTPGATTWPGKEFLLGLDAGWDGVKTL